MEHHQGQDVHPSQRSELSQAIDGFEELAVVRVDTVLRNDREEVENQLESSYAQQSVSGHHNMKSGESADVGRFWDPLDDSVDEHFDTVLTYVRTDHSLFVDLITVAVITDETHLRIADGEISAGAPQHTLEEFLSDLSTINPYYTDSIGDLGELPVTSILVGVPDALPPVRTAENGLERDLLQQFVDENDQLLRAINFQSDYPSSAVIPEAGPSFLISNQHLAAPFGPYAAVYFHPKNSMDIGKVEPRFRYKDGFRALVPLFRRFNWLRYRKSQIIEAEDRLFDINTRLEQTGSGDSLKGPIGDIREIRPYEDLLEDLRSDAMMATQIERELDALGNPYREKSSLTVEINRAFPLSENLSLLQMVNDGVYQNLIIYCSEDERFVRNVVETIIDRHQIARESLFAEISVTSTRENIRLQYVLLGLTFVLLVLTGVLVFL